MIFSEEIRSRLDEIIVTASPEVSDETKTLAKAILELETWTYEKTSKIENFIYRRNQPSLELP